MSIALKQNLTRKGEATRQNILKHVVIVQKFYLSLTNIRTDNIILVRLVVLAARRTCI